MMKTYEMGKPGEFFHVDVFEPGFGWEGGWAVPIEPDNKHIMVLDNEFERIPCGATIVVDDDGHIVKSILAIIIEDPVVMEWPVPKDSEEAKQINEEYEEEKRMGNNEGFSEW